MQKRLAVLTEDTGAHDHCWWHTQLAGFIALASQDQHRAFLQVDVTHIHCGALRHTNTQAAKRGNDRARERYVSWSVPSETRGPKCLHFRPGNGQAFSSTEPAKCELIERVLGQHLPFEEVLDHATKGIEFTFDGSRAQTALGQPKLIGFQGVDRQGILDIHVFKPLALEVT